MTALYVLLCFFIGLDVLYSMVGMISVAIVWCLIYVDIRHLFSSTYCSENTNSLSHLLFEEAFRLLLVNVLSSQDKFHNADDVKCNHRNKTLEYPFAP